VSAVADGRGDGRVRTFSWVGGLRPRQRYDRSPVRAIPEARARTSRATAGGTAESGRRSLGLVTYVIAGSCIKDDSCIEVCPVDCIHPKPGDPDFEDAEQLYIDPEVCIDCDACVEACPVDAIFPEDLTPDKFAYALDLNAEFFLERSVGQRMAG
jgi:ferredoxin